MRYRELAEIYDAENEQHAMLQEDIPFFLGQLPKRPQKILELACGTGRVAIPIAQAGHQVLGVDFDPVMIEIAQRKAQFVGLGKPNLDLRVGDALKLRPGNNQKFDWVCIFFNTFLAFATLEQQDACLRTVVRRRWRRLRRPRAMPTRPLSSAQCGDLPATRVLGAESPWRSLMRGQDGWSMPPASPCSSRQSQ